MSNTYSNLLNKIEYRYFLIRKHIYQNIRIYRNCSKKILFVIGCQRSGTSIMMRVFERDYKSKVYMELDKIFRQDEQAMRLKPLQSVKEIFDNAFASLIVSKPLLDTQIIFDILNFFPDSKAIFIFRHYKDVVSSFLKIFGTQTGIKDISPIVQNNLQDWRAQNVSDEISNIVKKIYSPNMDPFDAAALFWFTRNHLFFDLKLNTNSNVLMCKYEDLVTEPSDTFGNIYKAIDCQFPGKRIIQSVHSRSKGKGKKVSLSPEIESMCKKLWVKLNDAYG